MATKIRFRKGLWLTCCDETRVVCMRRISKAPLFAAIFLSLIIVLRFFEQGFSGGGAVCMAVCFVLGCAVYFRSGELIIDFENEVVSFSRGYEKQAKLPFGGKVRLLKLQYSHDPLDVEEYLLIYVGTTVFRISISSGDVTGYLAEIAQYSDGRYEIIADPLEKKEIHDY